MKYLANFKKIVTQCVRNGWLLRDPFLGFSMAKKEVEREALSPEELQTIKNKTFGIPRLEQVRDIFLFSCYTGLAYADVQKLKRSDPRLLPGLTGRNGYSRPGKRRIRFPGYRYFPRPWKSWRGILTIRNACHLIKCCRC